MADVMISDLITALQRPGFMPGLEEERQKLLNLLLAIPPHDKQSAAHDNIVYEEHVTARDNNDDKESSWLRDLKDVADEADAMLEEFGCVDLRAEMETKRHQSGNKVRSGFFCHFNIISNNIKPPLFKEGAGGFQQGDRSRISNVVLRIDSLVKRMRALTFQQNLEIMPAAQMPQEQMFQNPMDISAVQGLSHYKKKIVEFLLNPSNTTSETIVTGSIAGLFEIGKTMLAQSVCEDARTINYFEYILRIEAGLQFNVAKIAKTIIDQAIGKDCCLSEGDTDLLQHRLYQELSGKRYLLVCDFKWGLNQEKLLKEFIPWLQRCGGKGNSLIVISPDGGNELINFTGHHKWSLNKLGQDDMRLLFYKKAFPDGQKPCTEIIEIAENILLKLYGAAELVNLMGGLMRFKKEPTKWQEVFNNLGRKLFTPSILNLCCLNLSPEMENCFNFCFVFPKGYYMDKDVLIKLWMANGLFSSDGSVSVEEKGNNIFNELILRQMFEDVKLVPGGKYGNKHEYGSRVVCKMAEIFHKLGSGSDRTKCCHDPIEENNKGSAFKYLSVLGDSQIDISELLKKHPHLHTLMFRDDTFITTVNCSGLPENSLRALNLHSALFDKNLFEVRHLTPLRYVDLSGSLITRLPEDFSSLILLQTLNLSRCLLLCELPQDTSNMKSLMHLYVHRCPKLKKMPVHIGKLRCLTILTSYIVGESAGSGIDEIKGLKLGGLLELYNLSNVKNATMAEEVDLLSKTNLERLALCWGGHRLVMSKENNDLEVLEALQPHDGLKVLKIQQYGGHKFSTWLDNRVGTLNLVELHLIGCPKCETLPAVWKSSSLRVLCLKYMPSVTSFPGMDEGKSSEPFPSLKKLVLVSMKKFKRWHNREAIQGATLLFPVLDEMEITHCPELKTMPSVPMLKYLTITTENHRMVTSVVDLMTQSKSLIEVNMARGSCSDNEELTALVKEGQNSHKLRVMRMNSTNGFFMSGVIPNLQLGFWRSLISLEKLDISNCGSIVAWPLEEFRDLTRLKRIAMRMCPNLAGLFPRKLQEGEVHLPQLQALEFYRCQSLEVVPTCSSVLYLELDECPEITSISGFNNLEMLFLSCASWTSLPTGLEDLKNLKSLRVSECSSLTRLPDELAGLTSLQTLIIHKCPKVKSLPGGLDQMLCNYQKFQVSECPDLEKFCAEGPYSSIISQIGKKSDFLAGPSTNA